LTAPTPSAKLTIIENSKINEQKEYLLTSTLQKAVIDENRYVRLQGMDLGDAR